MLTSTEPTASTRPFGLVRQRLNIISRDQQNNHSWPANREGRPIGAAFLSIVLLTSVKIVILSAAKNLSISPVPPAIPVEPTLATPSAP